MSFSSVFKYLLDCEEITQKEFASQVHLSPSAVSGYIQGTREPDFDTLIRIADYFKVSTDYLLDRTFESGNHSKMLSLYQSLSPTQQEFLLEQAALIAAYKVIKKQ